MNERDPLSALLQGWRHRPGEDADFNTGVWERIQSPHQSAERSRWAMPLAACFVILFSLLLGISAAHVYDSFTDDQRRAEAYARSIDPLQLAIAQPHAHR